MYLGSAASTMATLGGNPLYRSGLNNEHMLVITSESAHWLAEMGWSKNDVRLYIYEQARKSIRELRDRGGWGKSPLPRYIDENDDAAMVPIVGAPANILILVAGGHQRHMNAVLTAGYSMSVTRSITRKDGTPIKSVQDFLG